MKYFIFLKHLLGIGKSLLVGVKFYCQTLPHIIGLKKKMKSIKSHDDQNGYETTYLIGNGYLVLAEHFELLTERRELVFDRGQFVEQRLKQFVACVEIVVGVGRDHDLLCVLVEVARDLVQWLRGQFEQQRREPVLPLLAVA